MTGTRLVHTNRLPSVNTKRQKEKASFNLCDQTSQFHPIRSLAEISFRGESKAMKAHLAVLLLSAAAAFAQVGTATSPRTLTRKIAPPAPPAAPKINNSPAPGAVAAPAQPAAIPSKAQQASAVAKVSAEEQKKITWQKERAEAGSASTQYDLALRYIEGKGVEKDPKLAKKWLEKSAASGNEKAKLKLAELDKAK